MFIDTHCHLYDEKLTNIDTISNYLKSNVDIVINMGCDAKSSLLSKDLSENNSSIYFGAGIHPENLEYTEKDLDIILNLASHKKCVAIGEIGLDYHYDELYKEKQIDLFIRQIDIANKVNLPICIHSRDAQTDTLRIIKDNINKINLGGVMHCFSGSVETAKDYLDLGFYISFGGTLTFKNANKIKEVAKSIPLDRILTETDSPYLAPHPLRGSINEPSNIHYIVEKLAELHHLPMWKMAEKTLENAKRLYTNLK